VPLLDVLLPRRCLVCGQVAEELCERCLAALPRLPPPFCARCGAPTGWPVRRCGECAGRRLAFASAHAAVAYDPVVRALVAGWKEHGRRNVAALAADIVTATVHLPVADALVPVPADAERRARRGHSPAARLAAQLGARWELPVRDVLVRRPGQRQRGLALAERRRNVRAAFRAVASAPARVVLVDDVYTSGSTAAAAASALRRAGATRVEVVTFARAVR
jgi:ComF family protein